MRGMAALWCLRHWVLLGLLIKRSEGLCYRVDMLSPLLLDKKTDFIHVDSLAVKRGTSELKANKMQRVTSRWISIPPRGNSFAPSHFKNGVLKLIQCSSVPKLLQ